MSKRVTLDDEELELWLLRLHNEPKLWTVKDALTALKAREKKIYKRAYESGRSAGWRGLSLGLAKERHKETEEKRQTWLKKRLEGEQS